MSDPITDQIDVEALNEALAENEAKVLYDMYVATDTLKDGEYLDVSLTIEKIVVTDKTVKVFYKNGTTNTYTG